MKNKRLKIHKAFNLYFQFKKEINIAYENTAPIRITNHCLL